MKYLKYILLVAALLGAASIFIFSRYSINPPIPLTKTNYKGDLPLEKLKLPAGFGIEVYAEDVENARSMALSPTGTLFVGTRSAGNVYALQDTDEDGLIDKKYTLLTKGNMPNGVAYKDGDLYIAEVDRVLMFEDIESKLDNPGKPIVITDSYPSETHHGWKYIAIGPDGKLYIPVGAPCNICDHEDEIFNTITRIDMDGSNREIVADGVRNSVGFDWHPDTDELWFTDNGRDWLGDEEPECELNVLTEAGSHFGYPYCHQGDILDPEFGEGKSCADYQAPYAKMGPHTAPLGCQFYTASNFPESYSKQIFVCRHGSWNRKEKIGYDVVWVDTELGGEPQPFITGWLDANADEVWGRPVDIELMPDGSMLISDDYANVIYRVYYEG